MNKFFTLLLATFVLFALSSCGGKDKTPEQLLVGDWVSEAPIVEEENGINISMTNIKHTYKKDHTIKFSGDTSITGLMAMEMSFSGTGTWAIEGDQITETLTAFDIDMKTEIPGMPNMAETLSKEMLADGTSTDTIILLDKENFVYKTNESDMVRKYKRK